MLRFCIALLALAAAASPLAAAQPPNPQIDYPAYARLAQEVRDYRAARLIDWRTFLATAAQADVLILDARSERQFAAGHLAGAINVPLPEFSAERLAEVIGRSDRPILIYCNNNFRNDRPPVILKSGPVALNIPTFLHLYAYGYRNIRELNDVMDIDDPRLPWVRGPRATAGNSLPTTRGRAERH